MAAVSRGRDPGESVGAGPGDRGLADAGPEPVRPPPAVLALLVRAAAIPGVGPTSLRKAVTGPEGPEAGLQRLVREAGSGLSAVEADRASGWARRSMRTIREERHHVLVPGLTPYPEALEPLEEPPYPLFARGRLELLDTPTVAIVGTRAMTSYGRESAHRLAAGLAAAGATVVSGLARGVDGAAHKGAGPARTVGVVGCGLDVAYPKAHAELQDAIGRQGLLLGELLPGTPPARHAFPKRNRIIAAVSRAVIVVEAPTAAAP